MVRILRREKAKHKEYSSQQYQHQFQGMMLGKSLEDNIQRLQGVMGDSFDLKTRQFAIGGRHTKAGIIYIDNLVKEDKILQHIVRPLMVDSFSVLEHSGTGASFPRIKDSLITAGSLEQVESFDEIVLGVLSGDTLLTIDGYRKGLLISTREYKGRDIQEPEMEPTVKGPKEGFVENIQDNIGLIRRRIRDPNLTLEQHKLGRRMKSNVVIVYLKGVTHPDIVEEVRNRIVELDVDDGGVASQLGQLITDNPNSIFPLIQSTERVDKTVASIIEGRVAVMVEGASLVLLLPTTLPMLIQSPEDYYENWIIGSLLRVSRYLGLFVSTLLPALYIGVSSFHPGVLPTDLALSIAGTRAGIPFPAVIEALLMEATLELLQEAGIRLPKVVGQTVAIVGGLVIGQAAVEAGIVSPIMVIVIAVTAISSFTIPDYSLGMATRVLRVPFMLLAASFGALGIVLGLMYLLGYLCSQESFGVHYMEPLTPYRFSDWKDAIIRPSQGAMKKRPLFLAPQDVQRQGEGENNEGN